MIYRHIDDIQIRTDIKTTFAEEARAHTVCYIQYKDIPETTWTDLQLLLSEL